MGLKKLQGNGTVMLHRYVQFTTVCDVFYQHIFQKHTVGIISTKTKARGILFSGIIKADREAHAGLIRIPGKSKDGRRIKNTVCPGYPIAPPSGLLQGQFFLLREKKAAVQTPVVLFQRSIPTGRMLGAVVGLRDLRHLAGVAHCGLCRFGSVYIHHFKGDLQTTAANIRIGQISFRHRDHVEVTSWAVMDSVMSCQTGMPLR